MGARRFNSVSTDDLMRRAENGELRKDIAAEYEVSPSAVSNRLCRAGFRPTRLPPERLAQMAERHADGEPTALEGPHGSRPE